MDDLVKFLTAISLFIWPAVFVFFVRRYSEEIRALIKNIRSIKAGGGEIAIGAPPPGEAHAVANMDDILWEKTGNIWWFCSDLNSCYGALVTSSPQYECFNLLTRVHNHASQMKFSSDVLDSLFSMAKETKNLSSLEWTAEKRYKFAEQVRILFNSAAKLAVDHQNSVAAQLKDESLKFRPDPDMSIF